MKTILQYLSQNIRNELLRYMQNNNSEIEEIRLRANKPIVIKISNKKIILAHIVTTEEILETFQRVCENSVYSYKKQICEGFITIKNGHRVGITGNCAYENGQIININYISSLNFRVAREKKGCSKVLLKYIFNTKNKELYNTLIVSRPGCGKTTILRDLIRNISNGINEFNIEGKTCGVVDERGEISAMYKGVPQNDVGVLTDVIENVSKSQGMNMLIRSMAPEVIACDEIGSKDDIQAINYAICSGVKGIFTAHGDCIEELLLNPQISDLLQKFIIEKIIFLSSECKGQIKNIFFLDKFKRKYIKEF